MVIAVAPEPIQVGDSISRGVPDGWHTRTRAAALVGRTYDTLRKWHRKGVYEPSGWCRAGQLKVWLYSDADIEALRAIAQTIGPGRPSSGD